MICPQCRGKRRIVPLSYRAKSIACARCGETGEVTPESEERRKRLCAMLRSMTAIEVAQRLGCREWQVVQWSISQVEIPEGVV